MNDNADNSDATSANEASSVDSALPDGPPVIERTITIVVIALVGTVMAAWLAMIGYGFLWLVTAMFR
jgi:hypothetical protein